MAHDGQNLILTILGMKGSGKSTLTREVILENPRVLILDAMGEYDDLQGVRVYQNGEEGARALVASKDSPRFLIDVLTLHGEETLAVLAVAFEVPNLLIVLEEASLYTDPHTLPDEIARIVRYGRKREISLVVVARRPSEIHRELTAQSDLLVTFRQSEPIDLQYLRARMGPVGDRAASLPPYRVLVSGDLSKAPLAVLARRTSDQNQLDVFPPGP